MGAISAFSYRRSHIKNTLNAWGGTVAITIVDVEDVLRQQPQPLTLCGLQALSTAREPYCAVLLQPTGVIEANDARVGHADVALGHALCSGFISTAVQVHAD